MEREFWLILMSALHELSRSRKDCSHHTHSTSLVVRIYLWAVLHDRPTSWACRKQARDQRTRPKTLPSQSTMSRRLRTPAFDECMNALTRRLRGRVDTSKIVVHRVEGKPLPIAKHSRDREAGTGYGAGKLQHGYKLHLVDAGNALPEAWIVTAMNLHESKVALQLIPQLDGTGYFLGDANYDDNRLYEARAEQGLRFVAPRRRPFTGLGKTPKPFHPDRLQAIGTLETARVAAGPGKDTFGHERLRQRRRIETTLGRWSSHALGFKGLPAWVRGLRRLSQWVHAKFLIIAAATTQKQQPDP